MTRYRLSRTGAFWSVTVANAAVLFASAAPSPIYPIYQDLWGFSSFTLTVVFAAYVVALLGSLLTVGSISDHVGRRPVIATALILLIIAMIVFILADGVGLLVVARVLQGIATGAILGTLSASIFDLQPSERTGAMASSAAPVFGLSLGVAVAGVLVQYAPAPRFLVYEISIVIFVVAFVVLLAIPETSALTGFTSRQHVLTIISPRASVPASVRAVFIAGVPAMIAIWALAGLQLSLGSTIVAKLLGVHNHAGAGLMLFAFFASAGLASIILAHTTATTKLILGYSALFVGVSVSLVSFVTGLIVAFLIGGMVAGVGFGTAFTGVMATIGAATAPAERAQVLATVFIVNYTSFSVPALAAGLAVAEFDLRTTAIGYAAFAIACVVVAAASAVIVLRRRPSAGRGNTQSGSVANCVGSDN